MLMSLMIYALTTTVNGLTDVRRSKFAFATFALLLVSLCLLQNNSNPFFSIEIRNAGKYTAQVEMNFQ